MLRLTYMVLALALTVSAPSLAEPGADPIADRIAELVGSWHEAGQFDGAVLVADRGRVVWKGGVGSAVREWDIPNGPDVRYPIASLSKQFTAVLVLMEVEKGTISLDSTVSHYLPDYPKARGERIRIRHLLSHSSGLTEVPLEVYFDPRPEAEEASWVVKTHASGELQFEPGSSFAYTNADYHVLQAILERVTNRSFADLLRESIVEPLGLEETGIARRDALIDRRANDYTRLEDGGYTRTPPYQWENWGAAGAMYSTVEDLHLWNRALVDHALLSRRMTDLMLTPLEGPNNSVALGSWVYPRPLPGSDLRPMLVERRGAIGGFAILNVFIRETKQWVVILANTYNEDIHTLPWADCLPLDLLLVLNGLEPNGPKPTAELPDG